VKTKYDYIHGSAAPKLPVQPQRVEQQKERKNPPVRKKVIEPEFRAIPIGKMVFCILIGFGILFTIIFRFSTITEMNCKLTALNQEYESLKDSNRKLQADIGVRINLENVRKIAEEQLDMKTPDSYQRIPVKVPRVNFSRVSQEKPEEKKTIKSILMAYFNQ